MKLVALDNVAAVIYPMLGGGSFSESKFTLCILETHENIPWQTVKTQMKCSIMQHNAAFHQGLHCLLRLRQFSGTVLEQDFIHCLVLVQPRKTHPDID